MRHLQKSPPPAPTFNLAAIRAEFPILSRRVHGKPLVYLDNAASTQKPRAVLDAMSAFYEQDYANIHRGVHFLSATATDKYETARARVQRFLNAKSADEVIFTHGATESLNLMAHSFGRGFLKAGDEVLITGLEHHANIVPWQMLRDERGIVLKVAPVTPDGTVGLDHIVAAMTPKTKLVSVAHVSNAFGVVLPVADIIKEAHARGIPVLLDGCQAVAHGGVDVQALDCDFYAFSGHKLYGPTGIGVLYGKSEYLAKMPPYMTGGDMIAHVSFDRTSFRDAPARFEAGTPAIVEAIGLAAAIDFLDGIGWDVLHTHETSLLSACDAALSGMDGVSIFGTSAPRSAIASFAVEGIHPHDLGTILDRAGVAIRAGHHCAQPLMDALNVPGTARASFALYNTLSDIDALADAIRTAQKLFG
jgi:cysteine desulfurase / selenocysteine lyase